MQTLFTTDADQAPRDSGFIRRRRKLTGPAFAQALLFSRLEKPDATIDELIVALARAGIALRSQSLEGRFRARAAEFFRLLLAKARGKAVAAAPGRPPGLLRLFRGVFLLDSTILSLPPPWPRSCPAAAAGTTPRPARPPSRSPSASSRRRRPGGRRPQPRPGGRGQHPAAAGAAAARLLAPGRPGPPKRCPAFNGGMVARLLAKSRRSGPRPRAVEAPGLLGASEWLPSDPAREPDMPQATLHRWIGVGGVHARKLPTPGGHWAARADADELGRVARLRTCPRGWSEEPAQAARTKPKARDTQGA